MLLIDNGSNFPDLSGYTIRIDNALAQAVWSMPISQQYYSINLSSWTGNGTYFVYLIDGMGQIVEVRKLVVQ